MCHMRVSNICIYVYTYIYMYVCLCIYMYTYVCILTAYMYTYIHMYIYCTTHCNTQVRGLYNCIFNGSSQSGGDSQLTLAHISSTPHNATPAATLTAIPTATKHIGTWRYHCVFNGRQQRQRQLRPSCSPSLQSCCMCITNDASLPTTMPHLRWQRRRRALLAR